MDLNHIEQKDMSYEYRPSEAWFESYELNDDPRTCPNSLA